MSVYTRRVLVIGASLALLGWVFPASAESRARSIRTEGEFLGYDAASSSVRIKVRSPGAGQSASELQRGLDASFDVRAEGSITERTTVRLTGRARGTLEEIPVGRSVSIYWRPDDTKISGRFARRIDVAGSVAERSGAE